MTDADGEIPFDQLPEGFAESIARPPASPARPRPAATIVLMREGDAGIEALLLRRNHDTGFVPGAWVFPGGRVDEADGRDPIIERIDGLDASRAARRLGLKERSEALSYYVAALREAFEETGILVALDQDRRQLPTAKEGGLVEALRDDLLEDRVGFDEVLDALQCRLDGGSVEYLAHWITPEVEPRRYDTRFFAARVPPGSRFVIDAREMTDAAWLTPTEALDRNRRGLLPMVFPTVRTLEQLTAFESVEAALATLATLDVPAIQPELVLTPTGVSMRVPRGEDTRSNP